tara:strand:- start:1171 stop:1620 length:450 start_codon:yes stop_codon:yes gene_type:complete
MEQSARVEDECLIAGEELVVGPRLDAVVEDLVENRGLVRGDVESRGGLVDRGDGFGGFGAAGELAEDAAFDFEDSGHRVSCGEKVSCRVKLAGVVLVFWREVVGGAEEVDDELGVPHDDRSSDFVVVLDESEALGSEAVGDALLVELLE